MEIPKDKAILINVGPGWTIAHYNHIQKQFVYANLQVDLYEGKWEDYYFDNEYISEDDIKEWKDI